MLDTYEILSESQYKEDKKFYKIWGYQNGAFKRGIKILNFWTIRPRWIKFSEWVDIKK